MILSRRTLIGWLVAALNGDLFRELLAQDRPSGQNPNTPNDFGTLDYLFKEIETARILPRMPGLMEAILRERPTSDRESGEEWKSKASLKPSIYWLPDFDRAGLCFHQPALRFGSFASRSR